MREKGAYSDNPGMNRSLEMLKDENDVQFEAMNRTDEDVR